MVNDALWGKLHELQMQLAAYNLLRAAWGDDACANDGAVSAWEPETCRGRQYEAYMRARDARRMATSKNTRVLPEQPRPRITHVGKLTTSSARCSTRDMLEVKRSAESVVPVPTTPRKENRAPPARAAPGTLPRSRTVGAGATIMSTKQHNGTSKSHQRRNSLAGPAIDVGRSAVTRPFLRRGSGKGAGAAGAVAKLRVPKVYDLPVSEVSSTTSPRQECAHGGHFRSVSELPFFETAALDSPRPVETPRARKRWGSPEKPEMFSSADVSHKDFSKGLKKLLSFVRKGSSKNEQSSSGSSGRDGWSAACSLDGPFDARLESHQHAIVGKNDWLPMAQAIGISG